MYATRLKRPMTYFPGRIFFLQHLWGCIQYLLEEDWVKVQDDNWVKVQDDWGHYDEDSDEWTQL